MTKQTVTTWKDSDGNELLLCACCSSSRGPDSDLASYSVAVASFRGYCDTCDVDDSEPVAFHDYLATAFSDALKAFVAQGITA